jgi:hypothetical protein
LLALALAAATSALSAQRATDDSLLVANERAIWEALKNRDTTAFGLLMGEGVVDVDVSGSRRTSLATMARYVLGCQTATYSLGDLRVVHEGVTAIVTSKVAVDQICWGQKAPSPVFVMTVYLRRADVWVPIAHSETPTARY